MTADDFRSLASSLPEVVEGSHMGHADFRVGGKIFATLGPGEKWGMVKLSPDEQARYVRQQPAMFAPFNNAWGRRGATQVHLSAATELVVRQALFAAWKHNAPQRFLRQLDEG